MCSGLADEVGSLDEVVVIVAAEHRTTPRELSELLTDLREAVPAPAYQRLASAAVALRVKGWSDHSIALEFGVTDKTIAKAIRWLWAGHRHRAATPRRRPDRGRFRKITLGTLYRDFR